MTCFPEYLHYYVNYKTNVRSDQLKMLEIFLYTTDDNLRKFCFTSLVKDKMLLKLDKEKLNPYLLKNIKTESADHYFTHILEKYYLQTENFQENNFFTDDDDNSDTVAFRKIKQEIIYFFYQMIDDRTKELENIRWIFRYYSSIILNTLLEMQYLKMIDPAQQEVLLSDLVHENT